jgi:capsular polysaccharide biosynthesis protein
LRRWPPFAAAVLWQRKLVHSEKLHKIAVAPPPHRIVALAGAQVSAQPIAVVGPDRSLLWSHCPQLKRRPVTADVLFKELPPVKALGGTALFAAVDGFSYYHWLTGTLPKLLFARENGVDLRAIDRVIVNPRHKGKVNFQTEALAALGIDINRVLFVDRGLHLRCDNLLLPPEPTQREQTDVLPWALKLLRDEFLPLARLPDVAPDHIFVRRSAARRRRLIGEDAIEKQLEKLGFTGVTLEHLPWAEQIGLFANAKAVVGLHGAGLANLVFSPPGTRVVEILPSVWQNPCFANLAARIGATYANLPASPHGERKGFAADAVVDPQELLAVLSPSAPSPTNP